jgi:homoserine dehydrogenase
VDIGRSLGNDINAFVPPLGFTTGKLCDFDILPIEEVESAHYLRVSVLDKPGVLSRIATIFSDLGISIEALIQREPREGQDHVPLIMLTTVTREKLIMDAVEKMEKLEFVRDSVTRIRVESLK